MSHQYGNSKKITDLEAKTVVLEAKVANFVDFAETGATTGTIATALADLIANLVAAGLMKAS